MARRCFATAGAVVVGLIAACGEDGVRIGGNRGPVQDAGSPRDAGGCADNLTGLHVHLEFDEMAGATAVDSADPGGHDGTLLNMNENDWVPGRIGNALDFDGIDDHVNLGKADVTTDLTTMTMCAWVFPRSYPNEFPAIADKSVDTFLGGWNFYIWDNASFGLLTNRRYWATGGNIALNAWQHLCASWDGTDMTAGITLYYNGAVTPPNGMGSNGPGSDSDAERDLLIGRVNNDDFEFDGLIDDYRLYGRVLTASEIATVYDCTSTGP